MPNVTNSKIKFFAAWYSKGYFSYLAAMAYFSSVKQWPGLNINFNMSSQRECLGLQRKLESVDRTISQLRAAKIFSGAWCSNLNKVANTQPFLGKWNTFGYTAVEWNSLTLSCGFGMFCGFDIQKKIGLTKRMANNAIRR